MFICAMFVAALFAMVRPQNQILLLGSSLCLFWCRKPKSWWGGVAGGHFIMESFANLVPSGQDTGLPLWF